MAEEPIRVRDIFQSRTGLALPEMGHGFAHAVAVQFAEVDFVACEFRLGPSGRVESRLPQQFAREVHQALVVRIRLVELQHREFRIVLRGKTLVAEIAVDLVDALHAAHHQPLQVQLRGDAQVEIDIQRIVVRHEGPRRRAAVQRLHHRRFHLDESARFQLPPQRSDQARARHEHLAHRGIGDQVQIALAVTRLHILQAVPLLRHGKQRLREELEPLHVNAQLARARAEEIALHADDIADIHQLEEVEIALGYRVLLHINLQAFAVLLQMREPGFTHVPQRHEASGRAHPDLRRQCVRRLRAVSRQDLRNGMGEIEAPAVGLVTQRLDLADTVQALLK